MFSNTRGIQRLTHGFVVTCLVLVALVGGTAAPVARAAGFTPGNLVLLRIGDGTSIASGASAPVFLDEYTSTGTLIQSLPLPTATNGSNARLTLSSSATSEGALTRSADGRYLALTGYDADASTAAVVGTPSAATNRVVARVDSAGVVDTTTRISDAYTATNVRGAVTDDGTRFWTSGATGGVRLTTFGSAGTSTSVSTTPNNTRVVNIFNGQLYLTAASGAFQGVSHVGSGTPTTSGQTTTLLPGFPTASGPQPYSFVLFDLDPGVAGVDTAYVADDGTFTVGGGGGLQKWAFDGTTWTLAYVLNSGLSSGLRGLTGSVNGSVATFYATTSDNKLVRISDTGAASTFTLLAAATAETVFRGVAFAPTNGVASTNQPLTPTCPPQAASAGTVVPGTLSATDPDGTVTNATLSSITPTPSAGSISVAAGAANSTLSATVHASADVAAGSYRLSVLFTNNDAPTAQTTTCIFTLTVTGGAPASTQRIRDIQGAAQVSPLAGQQVKNVPGIVTAIASNGFYIQDPAPDTSDATSEGIFVFTGASGAKAAIGETVVVTGTVTEFRPGGSGGTNNLTTTEIGSPTFSVLSANNPLPAPIVIGAGGRVPPTQVIEDDANGDVEITPNTFDPATDGLDFYESLEGMRVQVNDAVVVGPTTSNGEIAVVGDNGVSAGLRTARGGVIIASNDFNPERIIVDDVLAAKPPDVNVSDRFPGAIVGVMDYNFGNFKLLNTMAPTNGCIGQSFARNSAGTAF